MPDIQLETNTPEEAALVQRFVDRKDTKTDLATLRGIIRQRPGQMSKALDLCDMAFNETVGLVNSNNGVLLSELVKDRRDTLQAELGYAQALPAEKLLIAEVVLCWLRHYLAELRYTDSTANKGRTMEQGEYWERRVAATQRRYLRAIETLARVGKLLRSVTVQVNIGDKQVNVAGRSTESPQDGEGH